MAEDRVAALRRKTCALKKNATREDFLEGIATWEAGGGVTGHRASALWRYWKVLGPDITSQDQVDAFEYIRRALEVQVDG